ncbi:MAG: 5-formyltetrahydrofolate cyclo-ligase [Planctomycetota bacterium]
MSSKAELRRRCRAQRDALPLAQVESDSALIRRQVWQLPEWRSAGSVFVYAATAREVQTLGLIEDLLAREITIAVPRIVDASAGTMEAVVVRRLEDLVPGDFGILTPRGRETLSGPADLSLLPGLAFSPDTGVRLGLGGGYYDRYLAADRTSTRVGLAFDHQLKPDLPADAHDQPVHAIVTPHHVHRVGHVAD